MVGNKCKIKVQVGAVGREDFMQWVDGIIIQLLNDGGIVVRVPKADQLYYCDPDEVYVNLKDISSTIMEHMGNILVKSKEKS